MRVRIYDSGDLVAMYLDWFNNFLTVPHFAEYYGITEAFASQIIEQGREHVNGQLYYNRGKYITVRRAKA